MTKPQRYDEHCDGMLMHYNGEFITYKDHVKILNVYFKEIEHLREVLQRTNDTLEEMFDD